MTISGYQSQAVDRHVDGDRAYFQVLRQQPMGERLQQLRQLMQMSRQLAIVAVTRQHAQVSTTGLRILAAKALLQEKYTSAFVPEGQLMTWQDQDSLSLTQQLHSVLESLEIPYYLGGGLAAAVWGEPRVTTDADIVLSLAANHRPAIEGLIRRLESLRFYCPPAAVEEVIAGVGKTISVTHMETTNNADLIIPNPEPFEASQMERRVLLSDLGQPFWVCTAEDIVLQKLVWSRRSRSEKQWRQILGVLKAQSSSLDFEYLDNWAGPLKVSDRLQQAYEAMGL